MGVSDIRDLVYDELCEWTGILRGPRKIDYNIDVKLSFWFDQTTNYQQNPKTRFLLFSLSNP